MYKSFIQTCFALFLLLELTLAEVKIVQNADGSTKTIGCADHTSYCDTDLSRDRCCNGGSCEYNAIFNRSVCKPKEPPLPCGQTHGQCQNGALGAGCCNELDECDCSVSESPICVCRPIPRCTRENASCTSGSQHECCYGLHCKCNNDNQDCKCLAPPPLPCIKQNETCGEIRRNDCCRGFACMCTTKLGCHCDVPPPAPLTTPTPKAECLRRDAKCDPNDDKCCCSNHCIYLYRYKSYGCKKKPFATWEFGCSED